ncbi:MAG: zinc ribbon domain-containing protein [Leptolinea sp.]|jgi:hypothetical protein|nr:zinc ribbon domain-containing protein [Leptolinea sp.]
MEKEQMINPDQDIQNPDSISIEVSDDQVWKAFYSHSYTVLFKCENCDHEFDIDGWFYRFDTMACPKCKTIYSGIFGQLKMEKTIIEEQSGSSRVILETFEGEKIEINLGKDPRRLAQKFGHIVLIVFVKSINHQNRPLGIIDYCEIKPSLELFNSPNDAGRNFNKKNGQVKNRSFFSNLLFGKT